jgi:hypothetical protein
VAMVRLEGNMSPKNPLTPPGIDPRNHYDTPGPARTDVPSGISASQNGFLTHDLSPVAGAM